MDKPTGQTPAKRDYGSYNALLPSVKSTDELYSEFRQKAGVHVGDATMAEIHGHNRDYLANSILQNDLGRSSKRTREQLSSPEEFSQFFKSAAVTKKSQTPVYSPTQAVKKEQLDGKEYAETPSADLRIAENEQQIIPESLLVSRIPKPTRKIARRSETPTIESRVAKTPITIRRRKKLPTPRLQVAGRTPGPSKPFLSQTGLLEDDVEIVRQEPEENILA